MASTVRTDERLVLIAPQSSLRPELAPFRVISWPQLHVQPPESFTSLDEAIENLYGYDWILFVSADSVGFFIERLEQQAHEVSDLDSLRVCAIGEATAAALEHARVHVDVVATQTSPPDICEQLATYAGGVKHLDRVNFLLPQATIGRDYLKEHFENVGARADVIIAYQTVAKDELMRLAGLQSILLTGGVDAVVFSSPDEVLGLARVFDTNDLGTILRNTFVIAIDDDTTNAARAAGISRPIRPTGSSANAIIESLGTSFDV